MGNQAPQNVASHPGAVQTPTKMQGFAARGPQPKWEQLPGTHQTRQK